MTDTGSLLIAFSLGCLAGMLFLGSQLELGMFPLERLEDFKRKTLHRIAVREWRKQRPRL